MNRKYRRKMICPVLDIQACLLLACGISSPTAGVAVQPPMQAPHSPPAITRQPKDITCTHYVALDGEDGDPGTRENLWATLQVAKNLRRKR
jgi:hypothetical protein